jgi:hypothetical protein
MSLEFKVTQLYNIEYKEFNVGYFLKSLLQFKLLIFILTSSATLFSIIWANSLTPVYESQAMFKLGLYEEVKEDNKLELKSIETGLDLAKRMSYLNTGSSRDEGTITDVYPVLDEDLQDYIEIVSQGSSAELSSNAIKNLLAFIQIEHAVTLNNNRLKQEFELGNLVRKIDAIVQKQNEVISQKESYTNEDYESLLNTIHLMSLIDNEIGLDYLSNLIDRKEALEYQVSREFMNTELAGDIFTTPFPISPKKNLIVLFGFFLGFLLSLFIIFIKKIILDKDF